jgi:hypothetical protein
VVHSKKYRGFLIEEYERELDECIELVAQVDMSLEGSNGEYAKFLHLVKSSTDEQISNLDDTLCLLKDIEEGMSVKLGFIDIVTLAVSISLIGLKLTGYIAWSWWWVLSPMWIPFALLIATICVVGIFIVVRELIKK